MYTYFFSNLNCRVGQLRSSQFYTTRTHTVLMSAVESRHRHRNPPPAAVPCVQPIRCQPSDLVSCCWAPPGFPSFAVALPPTFWDVQVRHLPLVLFRYSVSQPLSHKHTKYIQLKEFGYFSQHKTQCPQVYTIIINSVQCL